MSLISKTPAQEIASELDQINEETVAFMRKQARVAYDLANTQAEQQAIMDVFGANATKAVSVYAAIHGALAAIGESGDLPAPDFTRFQPQQDGTVLYVAPPEPEANEE